MRDNPELDSSLAIDYIQNRRHFTSFYFILPFSIFFLTMKKNFLAVFQVQLVALPLFY